MKLFIRKLLSSKEIVFISHMVQMKLYLKKMQKRYLQHLYIPHGSDETISKAIEEEKKKIFISHMVQMKLISLYFIYN